MANTFTQMYVQIVFAVKGRKNLIPEIHREEIEKYICGIINNCKSKPLAIYCNPDHVHILIGMNPSLSLSDLIRDIKANSSRWINQKRWINAQFRWQEGYGAFTYSKSHIDKVVKYILRQPQHHKTQSFKQEYLELLKLYEIEFEEKYLFEWYE
ncbi:IS200/IS605 family transposase [Gelidibacter pelagius]|uniref:IS200/IS605 family transposase n=1 Tax=Gelidibacter pelagius TaxID=2819985 RepID=A0ABS3SW39_9FLAO|nr:IS200/IS605 family transposase [Gelidibacter pelagius]MBO3099925.1 IS200/IS605 family transposase [Gelidibacter pelagius]